MKLPDLLRQGESETLEFKASFNDETLESIGALANAQGGTVLVGVEDDGAVCGVKVGKKTLEDWANRIQEVTDPRLQPSITRFEQDEKAVIAIRVEPVTGVPVSVRGRYFRRVGRTNQRMSHEEIMQRMLAGAGLSWDAVVDSEAKWDDLDSEKVQRFMEAVRRTGRRPIPEGTTERKFLERLTLIQEGGPMRAALLLFGKTPKRHFPSVFLKLGRFRQVAEAFFYVGLIERWGTGTTRMADVLREAGLAEPEFDVEAPGRFRVILRKDPFSEGRLRELGLNERQMRAVAYVREKGKITNREYRKLTGLSDEATRRDLIGMLEHGILRVIEKGRNTAYVLRQQRGD